VPKDIVAEMDECWCLYQKELLETEETQPRL
jgi:hypothetical protein